MTPPHIEKAARELIEHDAGKGRISRRLSRRIAAAIRALAVEG